MRKTQLWVPFLALVQGTALLGFVPGSSSAATHIVNVSNVVFTPSNLTIQEGDVVRWVWVEGIHTTTGGTGGAPNGTWDAPIDATPLNQSFEQTFPSAGLFPYYCMFHFTIGMTGLITVEGQSPTVINPGTQNGQEEVFFSVTVFATDPTGDPLTMTDLGTTPAWATFTDNGSNSATISGTPAIGDAATYFQSVQASDASLTDTETFDIVIAPSPVSEVVLGGSGFAPDSVTIPVGNSIRWIKDTGGQHTTTSVIGGVPDGLWDSPLNNQNPTFERQFTSVGSFSYYCDNHPGTETGSITVADTSTVGIGRLPPLEQPRLFLSPHPNPFTSSVVLAFELESRERVTIDIFDLSGRLVRGFLAGSFPAGVHEFRWSGRNSLGQMTTNGVYFARLKTGTRSEVRKIFKVN